MNKIKYIILMLSLALSVDYESQIQPIFDDNCGNCHLGNSSGGLNLSNYNNLMDGSDDGAVVIPGNHALSVLYDRITRDNSDNGDMPPGNSELNQSEIDLIADWIDEGALPEESNDITGCTDPNAMSCDDDIDPIYFGICESCEDGIPCDPLYNPEATVDNGLCWYDDIPSEDEFLVEYFDVSIYFTSGFNLDWSAFTPPVEIEQYTLQRCLDPNGDSDGDGELEYENCVMVIDQNSFYTGTSYTDEFEIDDINTTFIKYTLYVGYYSNPYWGSAHGFYYYETDDNECLPGDVSEDGIINVIDIVTLVNYILGIGSLTDSQLCAADLNSDLIINVIDIVTLVNIILS